MTDERAEEIRASVAGEREAREVLWRLEDAGAAAAEREPARERAAVAADRVEEALTARDDDTDVNVDRLRGLRAAVARWREKRNLDVPWSEPVLIDGEVFALGGWIASRRSQPDQVPPWLRAALDELGMRWRPPRTWPVNSTGSPHRPTPPPPRRRPGRRNLPQSRWPGG